MNQNINFMLLTLIVLSVVTLLGSTIYYQGVVETLTVKYTNASGQIDYLNNILTERSESLSGIQDQLLLKNKRESQLSTEYTTIKEEKETLVEEKEDLQSQIESKTKQVTEAQAAERAARSELNEAKEDLAEVKDQLSEVKADREACEDDLNECQDDLAACPAG